MGETIAGTACRRTGSGRALQVYGLRAFATLVGLGLEGYAHHLVEIADAGALDGRHVHEHVLAAVVRLDETEPLLGIVKFHGANLAHRGSLLTSVSGGRNGLARAGAADSGVFAIREVAKAREHGMRAKSQTNAKSPPGSINCPSATNYPGKAQLAQEVTRDACAREPHRSRARAAGSVRLRPVPAGAREPAAAP